MNFLCAFGMKLTQMWRIGKMKTLIDVWSQGSHPNRKSLHMVAIPTCGHKFSYTWWQDKLNGMPQGSSLHFSNYWPSIVLKMVDVSTPKPYIFLFMIGRQNLNNGWEPCIQTMYSLTPDDKLNGEPLKFIPMLSMLEGRGPWAQLYYLYVQDCCLMFWK